MQRHQKNPDTTRDALLPSGARREWPDQTRRSDSKQ